jgi:hypothetical protein
VIGFDLFVSGCFSVIKMTVILDYISVPDSIHDD